MTKCKSESKKYHVKNVMKFDKQHPYYRKLWWRINLPWFLIDMGFAEKGENCEKVSAVHYWYKIDKKTSGCYFCNIIRNEKS